MVIGTSWYKFRGFTPETVRAARVWYTRFLPPTGRLLDIGCGRGEFLDVAAEAGLEVEGVDLDAAMVAKVSRHRVHTGDALDFLQSTSTRFDALSALHVVEHLAPDRAAALIRLAAAVLEPGGPLILATPNPGSLPTIAHEFWRDPTHVRPYDTELLAFLCHEAGLDDIESGVNPEAQRGLPVNLDDLQTLPLDTTSEEAATEPEGHLARLLGGQVAKSRYAHDLERAVHRVASDVGHTRDELARIANILRRFLEVAYEPSEVYVVARKPRS